MKKLNRIISLALASTLLLGVVGCTSNAPSGTETEVKEIKTLVNGNADINDTSTEPSIVDGSIVSIPTMYYQQFGADPSLGDYAGETMGGWKKSDAKLNLEKTAIVVMHAAYVGEPENAIEQFRYCEYVPRSYRIAEENFPEILDAARAAGVKIYHVPFGAGYFEDMPGYKYVQSLNAEKVAYAPSQTAERDDVTKELYAMWDKDKSPGEENSWEAIANIRKNYLNFLPEAMPVGDEPIATTSSELAAAALADGVNHLIYMGFAVDACLLSAAGGMLDMSKHGFMCSAIPEAVTAVESKESVRNGLHTEAALWRISGSFGFLYQKADIVAAMNLLKK